MVINTKPYYQRLAEVEPNTEERVRDIISMFFPEGDVAVRSRVKGPEEAVIGLGIKVNNDNEWVWVDVYLVRNNKQQCNMLYALYECCQSMLRIFSSMYAHGGAIVAGIDINIKVDYKKVSELLLAMHWAVNGYARQQICYEKWPDKFSKPHPWGWKAPFCYLKPFIDTGLINKNTFDKYAERNIL